MSIVRLSRSYTLVFLFALASTVPVSGQKIVDPKTPTDTLETIPQRRSRPLVHNFYVHVGAGFGMGYGLSEITEVLNDEFGIGISGYASILARAGIRNIVQGEYRRTDAAHNFNRVRLVGGQFQSIPSVKMDFDTADLVGKINPLAPFNSTQALFLVAGRGTVDWNDRVDDGFGGDSDILGVEYATFAPGAAVHIGIWRYGVTYDRATLLGMTLASDLTATYWVLFFNLSVGLGL